MTDRRMKCLVAGYGGAMSPWPRRARQPEVAEQGDPEAPPTVLVVAPTLLLTVSIERDTTGAEEVHVHAGGQGVWVARMLRALGCRPVICCPHGGESGAVARAILLADGFDLATTRVAAASATNIEEASGGERRPIVEIDPGPLDRHELDDFYGIALGAALGARVAVLTGSRWDHVLPALTFARLARDLRELSVQVVADLSGEQLHAALAGGVDTVKVSDEDLAEEHDIEERTEAASIEALEQLRADGASSVVISRGSEPTLALLDGVSYRATVPSLHVVEHRGSGDSMTAALAAGEAWGLEPLDSLRLAMAAGAVNVTRHGLGGAHGDVVRELAHRVKVERLEGVPVRRAG
jgi:1-phosphofructokinase